MLQLPPKLRWLLPHTRRARKIAAFAVTLLSGVWVLALLIQAWPSLVVHVQEIRVSLMLLGIALSTASAYLTFGAFATLCSAIGIRSMPTRNLAHLYFTAQLLKHLPGRVWGIGYQWAAGRSAGSLSAWLLANLGHMLLATFFALWAALIALGGRSGGQWCVLAFASGLIAYIVGWRLLSFAPLQHRLSQLPGRMHQLVKGLAILSRVSGSARLIIMLWFSGSWVLFYLAWMSFGLAYPALGARDGLTLCAYYMIAWFVGYISLLTPSGLGIRELVFAWIAHSFGGDVIALMAIVGRASLLVVDIVLGLMFSFFSPRVD